MSAIAARATDSGSSDVQPTHCAEDDPCRQAERPQHELDRSDVEVTQEIRIENALERIETVLKEKLSRDSVNDEGASFAAIDGGHRNVAHDGPQRSEAKKEVRFEEPATTDLVDGQLPRDRGVDGRKAVGGVEEIPVSGRELAHEREKRVADEAERRHGPQTLELEEAVALRVVGLTVGDRLHHFSLGPYQLAVHQQHRDDEKTLIGCWPQFVDQIDLGEPFGRIRDAIDEARKGVN